MKNAEENNFLLLGEIEVLNYKIVYKEAVPLDKGIKCFETVIIDSNSSVLIDCIDRQFNLIYLYNQPLQNLKVLSNITSSYDTTLIKNRRFQPVPVIAYMQILYLRYLKI